MLSPFLLVSLLYVERKTFAFIITWACEVFAHHHHFSKLCHIQVIDKKVSQFSFISASTQWNSYYVAVVLANLTTNF